MAPLAGSAWGQRALALALVLVGIPAILSVSAFREEAPIQEAEPSPRTVLAPDLIRVEDAEGTERAKRDAAEGVTPVLEEDNEARAAIVQSVIDTFARVEAVREAGEGGARLTREQQVEALRGQLALPESVIRALVALNDAQLEITREEAREVAQQLAVRSIRDGELEETLEQIPGILATRRFPEDVASTAIEPILTEALRPTVRIDEEATAAARDEAASAVAPVQKSYPPGGPIVRVGEVVSAVQMEALRMRGLEGAEPWQTALRAFGLTAAAAVSTGFYLRTRRREIWDSARRMLLLACLFLLFTVALQTVMLVTPDTAWLFVVPAGSIAMLTTILFDPPIGLLAAIPLTALVMFSAPAEPGLVAFVALTSVASVPLVSRLSARGDLRRAAWQSTLGYGAFAAVFAGVFGEPAEILIVASAGLLNGIVSAVIVMGSLPFLESVFGILTATSLLDLADRNHALLRELEQKALGSYNHSIEVSKMSERAARAIGADSLLASVAALYHDIGKVQRPYFFVENQFGVPNPHDNLAPDVSAHIIKEHVTDGIEMARTYRLPAEVVEGIRTHHGTTLVGYFYRQAMNSADNPQEVDERLFRYQGKKPASKEMAILMLADCCESATRAAALRNRNLSRDEIESIVTGLVADRVEDGQLDEADITFRELITVQDSFIESLCYTYHPRITYPELRADTATAVRNGGRRALEAQSARPSARTE